MTQQELNWMLDLHRKLYRMREIRHGLEKMHLPPDDSLRERSMDRLDQEIAVIEDLIGKRRSDVEETLDLVKDIIGHTILRLRFLHGYSWKEVGYYTDMSEAAAKARGSRALKEVYQENK